MRISDARFEAFSATRFKAFGSVRHRKSFITTLDQVNHHRMNHRQRTSPLEGAFPLQTFVKNANVLSTSSRSVVYSGPRSRVMCGGLTPLELQRRGRNWRLFHPKRLQGWARVQPLT